MSADIVTLGAASISKAGVITWQASVPVGNDNDDVEPLGQPDVFQSLGVDSVPYPKTDEGRAEGLMLRDVAGKDAVCVGGRDTRNNAFIGKMKPGDTTLHATGPGATAQCFVKNEKKQAGLTVDDADSKSMMLLLDGKNKKVQITARGAMIEIDKDGGISMIAKGGAGIVIANGKVKVVGNLAIPGLKPGMALMAGPPAGYPSAPAGPLAPVTNVSG